MSTRDYIISSSRLFYCDVNLNMRISRNSANYCPRLIDIIRKSWILRHLSIEGICDLLEKLIELKKVIYVLIIFLSIII